MKSWLWNLIRRYYQRRFQRQQLLAMDERMRKDLAISRVDAEQLAGIYGTLETRKDKRRG